MSGLLLLVQPVQATEEKLQWSGRIRGYESKDYPIQGLAGQTLYVRLQTPHGATYFNLLPPGSRNAAMFNGQFGDNHFHGVLPDDGRYVVRVYMMRSAARRQDSARFTVNAELGGRPLAALPASADRLVKGTRYHAQARIACTPPYAQPQHCAAGVIRRGRDGTATVVIDWPGEGQRRLLFVAGQAMASDAMTSLQATRGDHDTTEVVLDTERYQVPDVLLTGG
jgi:hypothetical protein